MVALRRARRELRPRFSRRLPGTRPRFGTGRHRGPDFRKSQSGGRGEMTRRPKKPRPWPAGASVTAAAISGSWTSRNWSKALASATRPLSVTTRDWRRLSANGARRSLFGDLTFGPPSFTTPLMRTFLRTLYLRADQFAEWYSNLAGGYVARPDYTIAAIVADKSGKRFRPTDEL
jgi:hypothetical protein